MDSDSKLFPKMQALKLDEFIARQTNPQEGYARRFKEVTLALQPLDFDAGPWLAGGSIRRLFDGNDKESDFDLFFASEEQLKSYQAVLNSPWLSSKVLYENEQNVTMEVTPLNTDAFSGEGSLKPFKLQLIKFYFNSPEAVLEWFDYTNCQFLTDGNTLLVGEYTLFDVGRKHLRVNKIHHALSSVRRLLKYARQGYTICDGSINDILKAVVEDPAIINETVRYID